MTGHTLPKEAHLDMQGVLVSCRVHSQRLQAQLLASADDPDSNLTAVRYHDLLQVQERYA